MRVIGLVVEVVEERQPIEAEKPREARPARRTAPRDCRHGHSREHERPHCSAVYPIESIGFLGKETRLTTRPGE